jgi:hypothetical protein
MQLGPVNAGQCLKRGPRPLCPDKTGVGLEHARTFVPEERKALRQLGCRQHLGASSALSESGVVVLDAGTEIEATGCYKELFLRLGLGLQP